MTPWAPGGPTPPPEKCQRCGKTKGDTIHHITSSDESIRMQAHEFESKLAFLDDPFWMVKAKRVISRSKNTKGLLLFFAVSGAIVLLLVLLR